MLTHNWLALRVSNKNVRDHLPMIRGIVYDLGCGMRPYEDDIRAFADGYIGVDWSNTPHALKADIVSDLNKPLPIEDGAADNVISFQVLEHLFEPRTMLSEAFRILKPGGRFFLSVPFQWRIHEAPHDYFRYTKYGLKYLLENAGFKHVDIKETSGFWSMWFLKLNYQTQRLVRGPRFLRVSMQAILVPIWFTTQVMGPLLDRCCADWRETSGYFVVGSKPSGNQ
jgi:SAM-dependent methyltransferase